MTVYYDKLRGKHVLEFQLDGKRYRNRFDTRRDALGRA
jgi:hypothetical protein